MNPTSVLPASQWPFEQTAQFFNPTIQKKKTIDKFFRRLKPQDKTKLDLPMLRRHGSQVTIEFDEVVARELEKYNKQHPNILKQNGNLNNTIENKSTKYSLLRIGKPMPLIQLKSASTTNTTNNPKSQTTSPDKKRNIKVLFNPFNEEGSPYIRRVGSRRSSSQEPLQSPSRPSKSQGKSFLQRKAQVTVLNRLFSSRSLHMSQDQADIK